MTGTASNFWLATVPWFLSIRQRTETRNSASAQLGLVEANNGLRFCESMGPVPRAHAGREEVGVSRPFRVGPLPAPTRDAMAQWLVDATENGDVNWLDWFRQVSQLRTRAAAMINADESEIALIPSTTTGINFVAEGYPWVDGDNVVIPGNEFPSNLFPWMHLQDRGVEVRQVAVEGGRVDPNLIDEACDERTRIVAVSWVGFATGWRIDVDQVCEIAHRNGALVMLDAIQVWASTPSTSNVLPSTSYLPTVTNGCSDRRVPGSATFAVNIWIDCGRWEWGGTV